MGGGGGGGGMLPDFFFCSFFPVQQTTSGIGHRVKLLVLLIHTFSELSLQLKKLSNANPACGRKEVLRSKGHVMVTTRYSDQQGSKS